MSTAAGPSLPAHRYRSYEEDSDRWSRFPFRPGDIVVSAVVQWASHP